MLAGLGLHSERRICSFKIKKDRFFSVAEVSEDFSLKKTFLFLQFNQNSATAHGFLTPLADALLAPHAIFPPQCLARRGIFPPNVWRGKIACRAKRASAREANSFLNR